MSLLKLCICIILQVLHPSTLSKILPHSVRSPSHDYSAPLLHSDTVQLSWAGRTPLSCLPLPCLRPMFDLHLQPLLDSPPFSLPPARSSILQQHPVPGSKATGAASASIPARLLVPSVQLLVQGASSLWSFSDISSRCCPWEMCKPSSQIPVEIHFYSFVYASH